MTMLRSQHVGKFFRQRSGREVRAVDDVTLTIDEGSFAALAGPSGSGKTTLLTLLGAMDRPTAGSVFFGEQDIAQCSDTELARVRRRMGFVFQDYALLPRLSVRDNITYPLIPQGKTRRERDEVAQRLLAAMNMLAHIDKRPGQLSGGERQRVAVARALAGDPEVLLADEPTSNLDPQAAEALISILSDIHREGRTVIVATHDPVLLHRATNVFRMEAGKLVTDGTKR